MEVKTKSLGNQISPADGSNSAAEPGEKEIENLMHEIVAKGLADTAKLKINDALMQVLDQEMKTDPSESTKEPETNRQADTADLSNESLAYNRGEEAENSRQRELKETFEKVWRLLEEWQSNSGQGLSQELKELSQIYRQLLCDIMKLYTQSQAEMQADRINSLLLDIIDKLGNSRFPNLLLLFETYGEKGMGDVLRAAVLRKITGKTISPRDIESAREYREASGNHNYEKQNYREQRWGKQDLGNLNLAKQGLLRPGDGQSGYAGRSIRPSGDVREMRTSSVPGADKGILYHRGKGNQINTNQRYRESVREAEQFQFRFGVKPGAIGSHGTSYLSMGRSYSDMDIECAENFIRHISHSGNLFMNSEITADNEELLGFLMAVNMTKVQTFTEHSGVGKEMASDVRNALERFFRFYLGRTIEAHQTNGEGSAARLDTRLIQRIYYQVMELVQRMKMPGKGFERGLQYVWEQFTSKKESEEYKKFKRYRPNSGFFVEKNEEKDALKELKYGAEIIDRDWREFLMSIGQGQNAYLQVMLAKSPWGILLEPKGDAGKGGTAGPAMVVFIVVAGICIFFALAGAFFQSSLFTL